MPAMSEAGPSLLDLALPLFFQGGLFALAGILCGIGLVRKHRQRTRWNRWLTSAVATLVLGIAVPLAGIAFVVSESDVSGPSTTSTNSTSFARLEDKVAFLERYIKHRRHYVELDFDIYYMNGGSFPPGPSEWDIRFVAVVPADELQAWVDGRPPLQAAELHWLRTLPTRLDTRGVSEWYGENGTVVGIDRRLNTVAFRSFAQ
jgi:hypothetical protein